MRKYLGLIVMVLLIGMTAGCGFLGTKTTGQIAISLTDAPATNIDEVWVTITKVEIQKDGEDRQLLQDLSENPLKVDLLTLRFDSTLLGDADLPEGEYSNIWLTVATGIENNYVLANGSDQPVELKVPSGRFNVAHNFTIEAGVITELVMDADVRGFIGLRGNETNNNGYIVNPTAIRVFQKTISSEIYGQVLNAEEVAITDKDVNVDVLDANQALIASVIALREDFTDPDGTVHPAGSFVLKGLLAGTYTLQVSAEGYETYTTEITVEENKDITLDAPILLNTATAAQ